MSEIKDVEEVVEETGEVIEECTKHFSVDSLKGKSKEVIVLALATIGAIKVAKDTIKFVKDKKPVSTVTGKVKSLFTRKNSEELTEQQEVLD